MMGRGSGRTARQLLRIPDGAVFVVGQSWERSYCMALLKSLGRDPYAVTIISLEQVLRGGLRGHRHIEVDHAAFETAPRWLVAEASYLIELRREML